MSAVSSASLSKFVYVSFVVSLNSLGHEPVRESKNPNEFRETTNGVNHELTFIHDWGVKLRTMLAQGERCPFFSAITVSICESTCRHS